jgi:hypothetical protein
VGLLVLVVLLAGCKVDARVNVRLRADGSGTIAATITLDSDAVHRLTTHEPLSKAVPLADLRAAGWTVSLLAVTIQNDPGYRFVFSHEFVGQADLANRLKDLVGTTGVLNDPRITRTRSWFGSEDSIALTLDLRHLSTGIRSDAVLATRLAHAGLDVKTLDAQLQSELAASLHVTVIVEAPGGQSKSVVVSAGKRATVSASTTQTYARRVELLAAGCLLLVLALLLTAASLASKSRRRRTS